MSAKEVTEPVVDTVARSSDQDKAFHCFEVGSTAWVGGRSYKLTHWMAVDAFLGEDTETGETKTLNVEDLKPPPLTRAQASGPDRDLSEFTQAQRDMAKGRLAAIKPLLTPGRRRKDVEAVAKANKVGSATVYRWISHYVASGSLSSLIDQSTGRKKGERKLDVGTEGVITQVLNDKQFMKKKPTPTAVYEEVMRRCRLTKVLPPHKNTVRNRVMQVPLQVTLRQHGRSDLAANLYSALNGVFPDQRYPFQVVQIDHTPLDIEVVDAITRQSAGRLYLTLAICVTTRMVAGLYLSFDPPNATSVAACIAHAMCPKRDYLAKLGVPGTWPVFGKMKVIHLDNAKEFRSLALKTGCDEYKIDLNWRPVKRPGFGGHIERLMGITAEQIHKLPGTTFSNIREKKGYDSTEEAVMDKEAVEADLVDFFVNQYHRDKHSALGMTPLQAWELGIMGTDGIPGRGPLPIPGKPERVAIDFLPLFERTIQRYGVRIEKLEYYDGVLEKYINATDPTDPKKKRKLKFKFRRDQRNAHLHFFDPAIKDYVRIPFRYRGRPDVGIWELNQAKAELEKQGREVDEDAIFDSVNRSRARQDSQTQISKAARRAQSRRPRKPGPDATPETSPAPQVPSAPRATNGAAHEPQGASNAELDALFAAPVVAFASHVVKG